MKEVGDTLGKSSKKISYFLQNSEKFQNFAIFSKKLGAFLNFLAFYTILGFFDIFSYFFYYFCFGFSRMQKKWRYLKIIENLSKL